MEWNGIKQTDVFKSSDYYLVIQDSKIIAKISAGRDLRIYEGLGSG